MGTSKEQLASWFDNGLAQQATHMIIVCDTWDWEDYPVYVNSKDEALERVLHYGKDDFSKVMEVYHLLGDKESQMQEHRSFNYGP